MKRAKRFTVVMLAFAFLFVNLYGCATTTSPATITTDFQLAGEGLAVAIADANAIPGVPYVAQIALAKAAICDIDSTNPAQAMQDLQTRLGDIFVGLTSTDQALATAAAQTLNLAWSQLQSYVSNASTSQAVTYIQAFLNGLCQTSMMAKLKAKVTVDLSWSNFTWNAKALGTNTLYLLGFKRK